MKSILFNTFNIVDLIARYFAYSLLIILSIFFISLGPILILILIISTIKKQMLFFSAISSYLIFTAGYSLVWSILILGGIIIIYWFENIVRNNFKLSNKKYKINQL